MMLRWGHSPSCESLRRRQDTRPALRALQRRFRIDHIQFLLQRLMGVR
jgi:hypothetical protein